MSIRTKEVAGGIIVNPERAFFLGTGPKWNGWVVNGGGIKPGETAEQAFIRETSEELNAKIKIIKKLGEAVKEPSADFKDPNLRFEFTDFLATISSVELQQVVTNEEFTDYGWFTTEEALEMHLFNSTRRLIESSIDEINSVMLQS
jgi:8-oxo-dGTP pyrophosphatase MutT (NUDIX family)